MEADEVAENMPLDGEDEGVPAALQTLEQVGPTEPLQTVAGAGQVGQYLGFFRRRRRRLARGRFLVVAQSVARQRQIVHRLDHIVGEQPGVGVIGILVADLELHGPGRARREVGARTILELQILAIPDGIALGVILLDEAARAAHEIQPHQLPPIVGVRAFLECRERTHGTLMPADELRFAQFAEKFLRANADILLFVDEQPELVRQVQIGLVVRRGRQENHATVVGREVLRDGAITPAFAVAQVMAFVDQHQAEPSQIRKLALGLSDGEHPGAQAIPLPVVFPHAHQVPRAEDERFDAVVILEDAGERGGHERLAQTHHIADHHPAALVEMMGGDLHRRLLELEQRVAEVAGNAEFHQPGPRLLGQVVGHLDVDVVRGNQGGPRPTGVDDGHQFLGDIEAESVVPPLLEPPGELGAGIVIQDIDVEFALPGEAGQGQVTAAEIADCGIEGIVAKHQVQLGVQWMAEKQLDHQFPRGDLGGETAQSLLVRVGRNAHRQLVAELQGELALQRDGGGLVDGLLALDEAHGGPELILGPLLHADEQPAATALSADPLLNPRIDLPPPAQIEVADAEVGAFREPQRRRQSVQQRLFDVVEDLRHGPTTSRATAAHAQVAS